jgi:hypothetical protein
VPNELSLIAKLWASFHSAVIVFPSKYPRPSVASHRRVVVAGALHESVDETAVFSELLGGDSAV